MTLTPEQREAMDAAVKAIIVRTCPDTDAWDDAVFLAGMRYAYEDAAKVCDELPPYKRVGEQPDPALKLTGRFDCAEAIRSRMEGL